MRNRFFLWIVSALLLVAGCTNDEIVNEQQAPGEGKITLTASVPGETAQTRLGLAKEAETKNISVTWRVGDQAKFFFEQNTTIVEGALVTLTTDDITMEGKQADFTVVIPEGINGQNPYTVYMVHGAESKLTTDGRILINVTPLELMPIADLHDVPVTGSVVVPGGALVGDIPLQHLGTLQCVTIKNSSPENVQFSLYLDLANWEVDNLWFYWIGFDNDYNPNSVPYYNMKSGQVENIEEQVTMPDEVLITIDSNDTKLLAQWIMPVPDMHTPEIYMFHSMPGSQYPYSSYNTKPERSTAMQTGKAYHLYALWDGTNLFFTDNTFTPLSPPQPPLPSPLEGDLMHAARRRFGDDLIGVVYSKGDGNVYYNMLGFEDQNCDIGVWLGETLLGAGSQARMKIDESTNPHVVFTTTDGRIAYCKYDSEFNTWSTEYITSNNGGTCSNPDIALDNDGKAHITYTDTKNYSNIMYATNSSGMFVKTPIYTGGIGVDGNEHYYNKGSLIALDGSNNYFIMTHHKQVTNEGGGSTTSYGIVVNTPSGEVSTSTSETDGYDIYDLKSRYNNADALYKEDGQNRRSYINIEDGVVSFEYTFDITTDGLLPHCLTLYGPIVGTVSSNLYHDFEFGPVTTDIVIKPDTRVMVVELSSFSHFERYYILYTDNSDSIIKGFVISREILT